MIKFGEWLPDIGVLDNPGATEAKNVVASAEGYNELLALQVSSSALDATCLGAVAAQKSDGVSYNFAGNTSKLYHLADGTWTDRSVGGGYSVTAGDYWEFQKWGDKMIAIGGTNVSPQIVTLSTGDFAALSGTPPKARHIAVVRDFVVMANYNDGTLYTDRIIWSGLNDETHWTTSAEKQSDYQALKGDGGWIQAIRGGEYGVVFQEHSIWRMDYIGPPAVFGFDETLPGIGTPAPNSVVQWGDTIYFLSQTGFEAVTQSVQREQIGRNRVNKYFYSNVEAENITRVVGALDRENRRIMWIYPSTGSSDGLPNAAIIYDIESERWSRAEFESEWIYDALGEGYTLEGLDAVSGGSIDALAESLDSRDWIGGAIKVSGFDSAHKSGAFSGSAMAATIETKEQRMAMTHTLISRVRPEVDGASAITITPGTRDVQTGAVSWGSATSAERDGGHVMRSDARYHRFRATVTGGFTRAQGITVVEGVPSSGF